MHHRIELNSAAMLLFKYYIVLKANYFRKQNVFIVTFTKFAVNIQGKVGHGVLSRLVQSLQCTMGRFII